MELNYTVCANNCLSVQCSAWTEYKFTCVCLCLCVYVTLSVNSPTSQNPQRIFIVDSLKVVIGKSFRIDSLSRIDLANYRFG